jgi:hypothetical protein
LWLEMANSEVRRRMASPGLRNDDQYGDGGSGKPAPTIAQADILMGIS